MRNSITFKKMLLLFCAVATPLFGFSFFLIHRNNAAEESRILSSVQEKTDQTASTLASAIEQLYHTASRMAEQSNLRRLADTGDLMSPYDISRNILLLQEQQTSIKNANQYVDNFIIYYEKFGKAYNSAGDGVPSFFEFSPEDYRILTDAYAAGDFLALYDGSLTGIVVPSSKSGFLIRMDFSTDALTKMLTDAFSEYEPYYTLTLFDGRYHLTNLPSSLQEAAEMPSPLTDSSRKFSGKEKSWTDRLSTVSPPRFLMETVSSPICSPETSYCPTPAFINPFPCISFSSPWVPAISLSTGAIPSSSGLSAC